MCLLKQSDRDTNCGHEECKNYYMLNKQMCMYNVSQPQQPMTSQNNPLNVIQSQIQLSSLLSQKTATSLTPQNSLNGKRPLNQVIENNIGEQESLFLNKKKVKPEAEENKSDENNQNNFRNDFQNNFTDMNAYNQQMSNQNNGDRNNQQAAFLNGMQANNGQFYLSKQDGNGYSFGNTIFIPMVQQQNGNMNNMNNMNNINNMNNMNNMNNSFTSMIQNQQNGFNQNNNAQMFTQNMKMKSTSNGNTNNNNNGLMNVSSLNDLINRNNGNTNNNNGNSNGNLSGTPPSNSTNSSTNSTNNSSINATLEAFMKEFQTRTSGLLLSQNKMLSELREKNDIIQDTLACLINEMSSLKNAIKQNNQDKPSSLSNSNNLISSHLTTNSNEIATTDSLVSYLYGPNPDFQYQLVMKTNLTLPLYRERNFKLTLLLTDKNGNIVENPNRIPLSIAIYSSESTPKFLDANTAGNKILKGFTEKDLVNGSVTFDKIQIKEVTSHFRNGWIFFVVYPKNINNPTPNVLMSGKDSAIIGQKIRPFVLEKVVVKAKKAKEILADVEEPEVEADADAEIDGEVDAEAAIFQDEDPSPPKKGESPVVEE